MTNNTLKEMREAFDNMLAEFSLDNLSAPGLVERALIIEQAAYEAESPYILSERTLVL